MHLHFYCLDVGWMNKAKDIQQLKIIWICFNIFSSDNICERSTVSSVDYNIIWPKRGIFLSIFLIFVWQLRSSKKKEDFEKRIEKYQNHIAFSPNFVTFKLLQNIVRISADLSPGGNAERPSRGSSCWLHTSYGGEAILTPPALCRDTVSVSAVRRKAPNESIMGQWQPTNNSFAFAPSVSLLPFSQAGNCRSAPTMSSWPFWCHHQVMSSLLPDGALSPPPPPSLPRMWPFVANTPRTNKAAVLISTSPQHNPSPWD